MVWVKVIAMVVYSRSYRIAMGTPKQRICLLARIQLSWIHDNVFEEVQENRIKRLRHQLSFKIDAKFK